MKYQFVVQFTDEREGGLKKLVEIENIFLENLSSIADVDGHDTGRGQINIFIFTDFPKEVLSQVLNILSGECNLVSQMKIAYRPVAGNDFSCIWPEGLTEFSVN